MTHYKKWFIGLSWIIIGLCFTSCIDDKEDGFTCTPTIPVESDLIDSWVIEYNKVIQREDNQTVKQQDFTKVQGKVLEIHKDYTWIYTTSENKSPKTGSWSYKEGFIYLTLADETQTTFKCQVFRLCSLRLRIDVNYKTQTDGNLIDNEISAILLRQH